MKQSNFLEKCLFGFTILILVVFSVFQTLSAQQYSEMRIIHKNGATIDGDDGTMGDTSVTMMIDNAPKTYPLNEVQLVMVKKGLAGKYALAAGGGCAAIVLISVLAASEESKGEYSTGQLLAGGLIWVGIFAGGGYLIGNAVDDWNTIYTAPAQSSIFRKFKFGFSASRKGHFRVGLAYNF
jgi:hypothetical protein